MFTVGGVKIRRNRQTLCYLGAACLAPHERAILSALALYSGRTHLRPPEEYENAEKTFPPHLGCPEVF
jgi:hypothetical protein